MVLHEFGITTPTPFLGLSIQQLEHRGTS